jgi:hypothetical protein
MRQVNTVDVLALCTWQGQSLNQQDKKVRSKLYRGGQGVEHTQLSSHPQPKHGLLSVRLLTRPDFVKRRNSALRAHLGSGQTSARIPIRKLDSLTGRATPATSDYRQE